MLGCPVDYFEDNLIFCNDRSCWALFEIKGYDYDMLGDQSKISIFHKLTLFIANIETEGKFIILPIMQDINEHFSGLEEGLLKTDSLYKTAVSQIDATKGYLQQTIDISGKSNDYKAFVSIKLQKEGEFDIATQGREAIDFIVNSLRRDLNAFLNIDTKDISKARIKGYEKLSEQVFIDQSKRLALLKPTTETTQWILRRVMFRGIQKEVKLYHRSHATHWRPHAKEIVLAGQEYLRPRKKELANLFHGVINKEGRSLKIDHDKETSYQTFLVITNIPEELSFPDCEWIYLFQQYNKQAEICIHIRNIEHREALRKIEFQRRAVKSQMENIDEAKGDIPEDILLSWDALAGLEAELKIAKYPLSHVSVTICLSDSDPDELEKKVDLIRKEYEDLNFIVERPLTDQLALFFHCIPCVSFTVQDFMMKLTPMAIASGLIGASHELGDVSGPYIGTTGIEKKHVFLNMKNACLSNTSASTVFYGNLGGGKSFNANLLVYLHVVMCGAYGLIIDPKGERSHWITDMTALKGLISIVTLAPDSKFKGLLDPYNLFRDNIDEASELAVNITSELFKILPKDPSFIALLEAIEKTRNDEIPSMSRVIFHLSSFLPDDELYEAANGIARRLNLLKKTGMAQLLIGDGTEDSISLKNRLNILQIQNMKLPDPNSKKEDYTQEESVSTVLMMAIAAFSRRFLHSYPNNFKMILIDESWMLGKTSEGEKLISYASRMSRSLYASIILNGHSVTDLPNAGIRNSITYKFLFGVSDAEEAGRMLDFIQLEKTPANINLMLNLGKNPDGSKKKGGECLFQDLNGRVGVLSFDAVFSDLIDIFSTTPTDATEEVAAPAPAEPVKLGPFHEEPPDGEGVTEPTPENLEREDARIEDIDIFAFENA